MSETYVNFLRQGIRCDCGCVMPQPVLVLAGAPDAKKADDIVDLVGDDKPAGAQGSKAAVVLDLTGDDDEDDALNR